MDIILAFVSLGLYACIYWGNKPKSASNLMFTCTDAQNMKLSFIQLYLKSSNIISDNLFHSKNEGKYKESIQSSTTHEITNRAKRSALSQQVTTRHQQTDMHESITKQDRNNIYNIFIQH